jgi:hypothetical protein
VQAVEEARDAAARRGAVAELVRALKGALR